MQSYLSKFIRIPFEENYFEVGDKIISKKSGSQQIRIRNNKKYNMQWGFGFILLGAFILSIFLRGSFQVNVVTILMLCAFVLPFWAVAVSHFIKVRKNDPWIVDLSKREIHFEKGTVIPFSKIRQITVSKLQYASSSHRYTYTYQANLELLSQYELTLFKDESQERITEIAQFLSEKSGIPLREKIEKA